MTRLEKEGTYAEVFKLKKTIETTPQIAKYLKSEKRQNYSMGIFVRDHLYLPKLCASAHDIYDSISVTIPSLTSKAAADYRRIFVAQFPSMYSIQNYESVNGTMASHLVAYPHRL